MCCKKKKKECILCFPTSMLSYWRVHNSQDSRLKDLNISVVVLAVRFSKDMFELDVYGEANFNKNPVVRLVVISCAQGCKTYQKQILAKSSSACAFFLLFLRVKNATLTLVCKRSPWHRRRPNKILALVSSSAQKSRFACTWVSLSECPDQRPGIHSYLMSPTEVIWELKCHKTGHFQQFIPIAKASSVDLETTGAL